MGRMRVSLLPYDFKYLCPNIIEIFIYTFFLWGSMFIFDRGIQHVNVLGVIFLYGMIKRFILFFFLGGGVFFLKTITPELVWNILSVV